MVIDTLDNADKYVSLHPRFKKAFEFIKSQDLNKIEPGKYPIDGADLHASVSLKDGVKIEDAKFEAHDHFIDIQVCPGGKEKLGWKPRNKCVDIKDPYNAEKDVIFFKDKPDMYFELNAGQFAIFYPEDVHAPMIGEGPIKKLVVKVRM
ncbi:MAG: YhcH/YjgK/YiaL family protein [Flavisolibacter sp.]